MCSERHGYAMISDLVILRSELERANNHVAHLEIELALTKQHAINWETTAKELRKQIRDMRMSCDTERLCRDSQE
jgi:predicted  nucleic acid-binding Zn-ribbon protein